ncbi:hypothetical protein E2C01_013304 [Portunus trituberculatus]|uniref:Uncharacterized protein n=1 Tax=Portunus trituberculatus TaxID=210409 RepID=A0A5B7DGK9_PORTR|nr:hypothetical protein [Portunus trituberculatus]
MPHHPPHPPQTPLPLQSHGHSLQGRGSPPLHLSGCLGHPATKTPTLPHLLRVARVLLLCVFPELVIGLLVERLLDLPPENLSAHRASTYGRKVGTRSESLLMNCCLASSLVMGPRACHASLQGHGKVTSSTQ